MTMTPATSKAVTRLSSLVTPDDPQVSVLENEWIPMSDGARLAARMFLPSSAQTTPTGAVLEYLPYRKRDVYRYRDDYRWDPFLPRRVSRMCAWIFEVPVIRTAARSMNTRLLNRRMPLTVIDWISRQIWCNGSVGMRGISYGAFTGLQAAEKAPAALKAIVSTCGTGLRYPDDIHYRGGCLIADQLVWGMQFQAILRGPPDPAIVGAERWRTLWQERLDAVIPLSIHWNEHQTLDAQWLSGSIQDYGAIRCAIYNVGGTLDSYLPSVTAPDGARAARAPKGAHRSLGAQMARVPASGDPSGRAVSCREWGARAGSRLAADRGPLVASLAARRSKRDHGRAAGLGVPRRSARRRHLSARHPRQLAVRTKVAERVDQDAPLAPQRGWPRRATRRGEAARAPDRSHDRLCQSFIEPFCRSDELVAGSIERRCAQPDIRFFAARGITRRRGRAGLPAEGSQSDRPVAKLCARLMEVTPDGHSHFLCYGLLNLTHRDSDERPTPLVPGHDYDVRILGHFACHRFAAGSRIRVALSETWWPVVWPSPEIVTLQVTTGASMLELPIRPTREGEEPPFGIFRDRYDVPGAQPAPYMNPLEGVQITGEPGSRTFTLVGGGGSLEPGRKQVPEVNTTVGGIYYLRRSIREDNPNTAEIETEAVNYFERDDWKVRVRARCLCRSTPSHFICSEVFEASDGDQVVFSRSWEKEIPRRLV